MDKETVNEFGYIVITVIIASIIVVLLAGTFFTGPIKSVFAKSVPEHEAAPYENDNAYIDYAIRQAPAVSVDFPVIIAKGKTLDLNTVVYAMNADGLDISENAVFYMDGERINPAFKGEEIGSYEITVYIPDKANDIHYGKITEKTFEVLVVEAEEETTTESGQSVETTESAQETPAAEQE